ncbi:MAG: glycosyltransferase family 39 protein [Candidatus Omnitrophota bacterium]
MQVALRKLFHDIRGERLVKVTLLSLIALGAVLRFYHLDYFDLWFDEAWSVISAADLVHFLGTIIRRSQPPLYCIILHFWINCFGDGEFALRALSAVFGTASIPLIFIIGKRLGGSRVGLLSALILAVSPFHIWYAQEVRLYALSVFFSLGMVFVFLAAAESKRNPHWWLFGILIISLTSVYLNYFSILLLLPASIFYLSSKRVNLAKIVSVLLLMVLFCLPLFSIAWQQILEVKDGFWVKQPNLNIIFITLGNFLLGYNSSVCQLILSAVIFSLAIIIWCLRYGRDKERLLLLGCTIFPLGGMFVFSQYIPIYVVRYLIIFSPFFYVILSSAIFNIPYKIIRWFILAVAVTMMVFSLLNYYQGVNITLSNFCYGVSPKKPFEPIIKYIKERKQAGDFIAHSGVNTLPSFLYYLRDVNIDQKYLLIPEEQQDNYWKKIYTPSKKSVARRSAASPFYYETKVFGLREEYYDARMWLISAGWRRDGELSDHANAVRERAHKRFKNIGSFYCDGIYVDLFSLKGKN